MPGIHDAPTRAASTGSTAPRLPAEARRLRLPLYARSQERMRARWGFDLNAPDAAARADAESAAAPEDGDALVLLAAVRASRGDDEGALAAARAAVARDASSARARATLAALLVGAGDAAGARAHAEEAARLDPGDPAAAYNLGLVLWSLGEHRAAREQLRHAASLLQLPPLSWWQRMRV